MLSTAIKHALFQQWVAQGAQGPSSQDSPQQPASNQQGSPATSGQPMEHTRAAAVRNGPAAKGSPFKFSFPATKPAQRQAAQPPAPEQRPQERQPAAAQPAPVIRNQQPVTSVPPAGDQRVWKQSFKAKAPAKTPAPLPKKAVYRPIPARRPFWLVPPKGWRDALYECVCFYEPECPG